MKICRCSVRRNEDAIYSTAGNINTKQKNEIFFHLNFETLKPKNFVVAYTQPFLLQASFSKKTFART